MTKEIEQAAKELELDFERCYDDNTSPTGGGYEADYTDKWGFYRSFKPFIDQYAAAYHKQGWVSAFGKVYFLVNELVFVSVPFDQWDDGDFEGDCLTDQIRVLISKNENGYYVANAMNGYGNNCLNEYASAKVVLLIPSPPKTDKQ